MDKICVMLIKLCMEGNTFACIKEGNSYTKMDKIYLESNRKCVKDLFYLHLTLKRFKNILLLFYWIINIKKIIIVKFLLLTNFHPTIYMDK
jgi:hypothetical protein